MTAASFDFWMTPDGWPLRTVRLEGGGARGALLFLGGRGDPIEKYRETLDHWAQGGWAVESFDWRGQGGSGRFVDDPQLGHADDFSVWLADLDAYASEWRARTAGPHVMVGHSMGGHLLLRALVEGRVEADAAVLVAPMIGIHAGGLPGPFARNIAGAACAMGHARRSLWPQKVRQARLEEAIRTTLTHSKERYAQELRLRREQPDLMVDAPSWGWLNAAYRSMARLSEPGLAEGMRTPTFMLATSGDRLVSTPAIAKMARRLPDAHLHLYGRNVAHEILREVDAVRDDALRRIDAFFDERAPAPGTGQAAG